MLERGRELSSRFVLERCLGKGGSASVWLAQDRERGGWLALKILSDELGADPVVVARLQLECRQAQRLQHPSILRVEGFYRTAEHAWIAMEYAPGGDASQLRGRGAREILHVLIPIASALGYAHQAGVIHRDVKPANLLLMADGSSRLADFGSAAALGCELRQPLASPYTMSPQQRAGEPPMPADDVYSFGATVYELLSGYPPFYARGPALRIQEHAAAELPSSVPPRLAQLVQRMLAVAPAERPESMQSVERELKSISNDESSPTVPAGVKLEPPSLRPPGVAAEPLRGEWKRSSASGPSERDLRRQGLRRGLGVAAIIAGLAAVALVFVALPRWVEQERPSPPVQAAALDQPTEEQAAAKKQEIDFAALARAKQEAEELRPAIDERLKRLQAQAVDVWGGEAYQQASDALSMAHQRYDAREYSAALEQYKRVPPLLDALEQRAPAVLAEQLELGQQALIEGRSADALTAYALAAKIEPGNQIAARGLKRAGTLDQVLDLVATAQRLESEGRTSEALAQYRKAAQIDPELQRAQEGVARIESQLAANAFASTMARGFTALAAGNYSGARAEFEAARKLRPNAPEIDQALRQIEQVQRTGIIETKLAAARELESQEQWAGALQEYRAILQLDSTIAAANEGVQRVSPRAALNEQLELYLTQPERLFSQPVRASARDILQRARTIDNPGPVLQRQIQTLADWLQRADAPVPVALQSDNLTQVTIYRVGSLGTFERHSLELAPGTYTVVGTRPGYRDVRRQINVMPGSAPEPVVIRCEEPI